MAKRFVFVTGDIGGTRYFLPVYNLLKQSGHEVHWFTDTKGQGVSVLRDNQVPFRVELDNNELDEFMADSVFLVNTCASATGLGEFMTQTIYDRAPLIMGADGYFNHCLPKWRDSRADYWFAIDEGHGQAILEQRPGLNPSRVIVVGQPAFDSVLDYVPRKDEVRKATREKLGIDENKIVLLWWSQGMLDVIYEDVCMLFHGFSYLIGLTGQYDFIVIPRIHPKLNQTVSPGYVRELEALFCWCRPGRINVCLDENRNKILGEKLCLAADVILSVTATEDIKNVMMGGPPIVHLIGPLAQRWFEKDLLQSKPYLPDLRTGQSLVAWSVDQVGPKIIEALNPDVCQQLLSKWQPSQQKAVEKMTGELIKIARL